MSDFATVAAAGAIGVALLVCLGYFNAMIDGWLELGRRFPDRSGTMPSAKAGTVTWFGDALQWKAYVTVGVDDDGLHLRTSVLGRVGHKPVLIPWDTVERRGPRKRFLRTVDTYGVGFFTTIGLARKSKAARLMRERFEPAAVALREPV